MKCKKCGYSHVVNKHFQLCLYCNNIRLYGNKYGKRYKPLKNKLSNKAINTIEKDEELYEKVFNSSNHCCEECGARLNTTFRDPYGQIIYRFRYAHRFPKSIYPEWRHKKWNIMNLCFNCHQRYDFKDKKNMNVWVKSLILYKKHI